MKNKIFNTNNIIYTPKKSMKISAKFDLGNNPKNLEYSNVVEVRSAEELLEVVKYDHICGEFRDNIRGNDNFLRADCIVMDVDNDDDNDIVTPEKFAEKFKNISYVLVSSRNHMKEKNGKFARPRFHVYFDLSTVVESADEIVRIKQNLVRYFGGFDKAAKDASRFIFGNESAEILDDRLSNVFCVDKIIFEVEPEKREYPVKNENIDKRYKSLPEVVVRRLLDYIDSDNYSDWVTVGMALYNSGYDYGIFNDWSAHSSKYNYRECKQKWNSFRSGENRDDKLTIGTVIYMARQNGYIEEADSIEKYVYIPQKAYEVSEEYVQFPVYCNDVSEYDLFKNYLDGKYVCDSNGKYYKLIDGLNVWSSEEYIGYELYNKFYCFVIAQLEKLEITEDISDKKKKEYKRFFNGMLSSNKMNSLVSKSLKSLLVSPNEGEMDIVSKDDMACIPCGNKVYYLENGFSRDLKSGDYCTGSLKIEPSDEGREEFERFLHTLSCDREDWEEYMQKWCGGMLLGSKNINPKVLIAYSKHGRAGKSTWWNLVQRILEGYSCSLPADILAKNFSGNKKNYYSLLENKLLVICPEFPRNTKIDDASLKILSSRDSITVEHKFEKPRDIESTHSCVLYTNHLPKLDDIADGGVRRRLVVVPFDNYFDYGKGNADDNISNKIYRSSGGYILKWMMEGARKFLELQDRNEDPLVVPECIRRAGQDYENDNNPLFEFFRSKDFSVSIDNKSNRLAYNYVFQEYINYCTEEGKKARFTKTGLKKKILELYGSDNRVYDKRIAGVTYLYGLVEGVDKDVDVDKVEILYNKQSEESELSKYKFKYDEIVKENNELRSRIEELEKRVSFSYRVDYDVVNEGMSMDVYESKDSVEYKRDLADSQEVLDRINESVKYGRMELESPWKVKERKVDGTSDEISEACYEEFRVNADLALRRNVVKEVRECVKSVMKEMKSDEGIMKKSKEEKFEYLDSRVRSKLYWYDTENHVVESRYLAEIMGKMKEKVLR